MQQLLLPCVVCHLKSKCISLCVYVFQISSLCLIAGSKRSSFRCVIYFFAPGFDRHGSELAMYVVDFGHSFHLSACNLSKINCKTVNLDQKGLLKKSDFVATNVF